MDLSRTTVDPPKSTSRRDKRPLYWLVCGAVLGAIVTFVIAYATRSWWAIPRLRSFAYENLVKIYLGDKSSDSLIELNDGATGQVLCSMMVADETRRVTLDKPEKPLYTIRFGRPAGSYDGPGPGFEVRRTADGYAWSEGDSAYRMFGDFDAFLAAIPAVRCMQMIHHHSGLADSARADGERLKKLRYDSYCDALLALCESDNPRLRSMGFSNLAKMFSPSPRLDSPRWTIDRRWERAIDAPRAAEVRRAALAEIEQALRSGDKASTSRDDRCFSDQTCICLQLTGDLSTADVLAEWMQRDVPASWIALWIPVVEAIHGLPPTYQRRGICGNSSREEREQSRAAENVRCLAARDQLVQWHRDHGKQGTEARYDAILDAWCPHLRTPTDGYSFRSACLASAERRLLSLGPALLPALDRRIARETDLQRQAEWSLVRTYITSDCDERLIERLLESDIPAQIAACRLIAASEHSKWRNRLVSFLQVPGHDPTGSRDHDEVEALHEAAAYALLVCHGPEILPELRGAKEPCYTAKSAIQYYEQPTWQ
jgi:hypothetical protein